MELRFGVHNDLACQSSSIKPSQNQSDSCTLCLVLGFFLLEGVSILSIKHLIMQKLLKVAADLKKLAVALVVLLLLLLLVLLLLLLSLVSHKS